MKFYLFFPAIFLRPTTLSSSHPQSEYDNIFCRNLKIMKNLLDFFSLNVAAVSPSFVFIINKSDTTTARRRALLLTYPHGKTQNTAAQQ